MREMREREYGLKSIIKKNEFTVRGLAALGAAAAGASRICSNTHAFDIGHPDGLDRGD